MVLTTQRFVENMDHSKRNRKASFAGVSALKNLANTEKRLTCNKRKLSEIIPHPPDHMLSPSEYVREAFEENGYDPKDSSTLEHVKFLETTKEMIAAWKAETVNAVRSQDLDKLRQLHEGGELLQCSNQFGESLIHMACRRGFTKVVSFLVREAKVSLFVKDDFGRSPGHDCCWTPEPNFRLLDIIIDEAPELLCIKDVRGHAPLDYVRKEHWEDWRSFLSERRSKLRPKPASCP